MAIQPIRTEVKSNYSTIAGIPGTMAVESLLVFRHAVYRSMYCGATELTHANGPVETTKHKHSYFRAHPLRTGQRSELRKCGSIHFLLL